MTDKQRRYFKWLVYNGDEIEKNEFYALCRRKKAKRMSVGISRGLLLYEFHILPCLRIEWRNDVRIELCWLHWYIGLCFDKKETV